MESIIARNVPEAFLECLWRMRICGVVEDSRNGPVTTIPRPFMLTITAPWERVLTEEVRMANPFFHMAEFIWMMAGSRDIQWIARYNKRMLQYSDDGVTQAAGYGHRWREHFGGDQIKWVVELLKEDLNTRRAVLGMWDPVVDNENRSVDLPCNTHIYLRVVQDKLTMTVCNRSNDLIWGMLGANAVHMTMLHELIAQAVGVEQGDYNVFTNNLHIYHSVPNFKAYMGLTTVNDQYRNQPHHVPLLAPDESLSSFFADAKDCVFSTSGYSSDFRTAWFERVAKPMLSAYNERLSGKDGLEKIWSVAADDWRVAARLWTEWKK